MSVQQEPVTPQTIRVDGPVDVRTAADLRRALLAVYADGGEVVLDLQGHAVRDRTGFGLLAEAYRRSVRNGVRLRLVGVEEGTARVLARLGLARALGATVAAVPAATPVVAPAAVAPATVAPAAGLQIA